MNPKIATDNLFTTLIKEYSGGADLLMLTPASCAKTLSEIQLNRGIPMIAMSTWLSEKERVSPSLRNHLKNESDKFRAEGKHRTSCVSVDGDGYLFMREDQSVVLQDIPSNWNSDMELHELIENLRIEEQDMENA